MRKLCLQATCLLLQTRPASASDLLAPTGATLTVPTGTLRAAYIVTNLAHATHGPTSTATAVIPPTQTDRAGAHATRPTVADVPGSAMTRNVEEQALVRTLLRQLGSDTNPD